ncbi:hypothetical protein [Streptomyces sp. NPDC048521]|uniref:hypothetical protein n=1 Tax=Streptomyces sp. NPDC048521 TaxID=3365566 RepID=UPI00371540AC
MQKPLKRLIASLTLATAVATGTLIATESVAAHKADTTWGASATTDDTGWGTPPGDILPINLPIPLDTGWG